MKYSIIIFFVGFVSFGQDLNYKIESYLNQDLNMNKKAPNTHYIGNAWLKRLILADNDFDYNLTQATFQADSTLDWHKHSTGQVLIIIDGEGYYQERGKEVVILKKGDIIKCDKNVEHWHSSTPNTDVSYIAIYGDSETIWTEKLSKKRYDEIHPSNH
ncbi:MAG: cupin domain-containing protein [Flavobacteriaceae bacterium]|jgi:quercetin dioxygenase-like cupin family protein|nr:cupin domain-containing protein [Flavobacteriaceae bacterium]MDG1912777.1 cupin domain-containing protein [Flavobacteriaceae bacterium]|tara:strand:+ start:29 stop:502 length:474 start_codon:yes stop_codon:yes gene_type:complete